MAPHKEWVNSFFITKDQKTLEVGIGTGKLAKYVQEKCECDVTAIDYSEKMLSRVEESKVKYLKADATNLPFEDGSFDFVFSSSLLNIVSDKRKTISEMLRVSRDGAIITFLVPSEQMNNENATKYIQKNNLKGFSKSALLFWTKRARIFSKKELEETLKEINYGKSLKTKYFFNKMLVCFILEK